MRSIFFLNVLSMKILGRTLDGLLYIAMETKLAWELFWVKMINANFAVSSITCYSLEHVVFKLALVCLKWQQPRRQHLGGKGNSTCLSHPSTHIIVLAGHSSLVFCLHVSFLISFSPFLYIFWWSCSRSPHGSSQLIVGATGSSCNNNIT